MKYAIRTALVAATIITAACAFNSEPHADEADAAWNQVYGCMADEEKTRGDAESNQGKE